MSDLLNVIIHAEMTDGTLAVVEDALNKGVYHVYKNDKNVQPNHDALGVMRYLAVIVHAQDYRANNAEILLNKEREKTTKLDAKVKLLEDLVGNISYDAEHVAYSDMNNWQVRFSYGGAVTFRHNNDEKWQSASTVQEMLTMMYNKEIK